MTGFEKLDQHSSYSKAELNLADGQLVSVLTSPPQNSSVFLYDSALYAFTSGHESDYLDDRCGNGVLRLSKYDLLLNTWKSASDNLTFSDVNDLSYYSDASILTSEDSDTVYIYGGRCELDDEPTNRLLALDMKTFTFSNTTTSTQPQPFYGASSQWAPNPQNLLVIGGKASNGWLNMYQLATWNFDSGWLFQQIEKNDSTTVHSRVNTLVLPKFSPLRDNSPTTFSNNYRTSSLLIIGGESANGAAEPALAEIILDQNNWSWKTRDNNLDTLEIMGAAVIFDTLVVVNGLTLTKRDSGSAQYNLNLYDLENDFKQIHDLLSNTRSPKKQDLDGNSSSSVTQKAVIGTIVPVAALAMAAAAGLFIWKKKASRKSDNMSLYESVDYQLGRFRTPSDPFASAGAPRLSFESGSTLSEASLDSWAQKKHEYEKRNHTVKRHSFLASNETLSIQEKSEDSEEDSQAPRTLDPRPPVPARVNNLRNTHSYNHTPTSLPLLKRDSRRQLVPDNDDDNTSFDDNVDVQVLVSSKRKSVLRVVNPDIMTITDEDLIRQRTPSK